MALTSAAVQAGEAQFLPGAILLHCTSSYRLVELRRAASDRNRPQQAIYGMHARASSSSKQDVASHANVSCFAALQARLADSNRNLAARVLLFTADMARAMGPTFDRLGKQLLLASVPLIHESKKQVCYAPKPSRHNTICPCGLLLLYIRDK